MARHRGRWGGRGRGKWGAAPLGMHDARLTCMGGVAVDSCIFFSTYVSVRSQRSQDILSLSGGLRDDVTRLTEDTSGSPSPIQGGSRRHCHRYPHHPPPPNASAARRGCTQSCTHHPSPVLHRGGGESTHNVVGFSEPGRQGKTGGQREEQEQKEQTSARTRRAMVPTLIQSPRSVLARPAPLSEFLQQFCEWSSAGGVAIQRLMRQIQTDDV